MANEKLTEYERRRLENIRRNDEMMAALKIHAKASLLSAATKRRRVECKSYKSTEKKSKPETPIVIRRSLRTRGLKPDSGGLTDDKFPKSVSFPKQSPTVMGPLAFEDAYDGWGSDRQFVDTILDIAKKSDLGKSVKVKSDSICKDEESRDASPVSKELRRCTRSPGRASSVVKCEDLDSSCDSAKNERVVFPIKCENSESRNALDLESLTLEPKNVARVVPGRIFVVKFLPCADVNMVAAGDKLGNIGFWNLDSKDEEDGIYLYHPHSAPVSSILFQRSSLSKVITSCYGGFIRLMDAEKSVFDLVYSSSYAVYSLSQRPEDEQSLYFGEGAGGFNVWDLRAGKSSFQWDLHEGRINSVDFNPQKPYIMATSSSDGTACLWDLRRMGAKEPRTLNTLTHGKAVHSAYFSPSGLSLATTSFDNHVGILGGSNFEDISMIDHNNHTSRWISTFRGIWGWDDSYIFIGNVGRGVDVISTAEKRTVKTLQSPNESAISCRFHSHPLNVGMLAGSTAGGQVYVWSPN
ncbi:PREDICTED: WD repeat-containing protein 76 [Tarenaya hassleriana]|uniref:WD repeat-containing protein 76 n=1 Tax=Tarenaya hassleriana TaxID=28532 RepID=UPI00053C24E6|nr:PREDICTED: WD repeat-containing protein 76 [Tarenaya hassleriana]